MKILLSTIFASVAIFSLDNISTETNSYCEFNNSPVIYEKIIYDFNNNMFKLYELEKGYAIYSIKENEEEFIEGSYFSNSPYFNIINEKDIYYLGPGNYYYMNNNIIYNIIDGTTINYTQITNASYDIYLESDENSIKSGMTRSAIIPDENNTTTDTEGFVVINNHNYFRKLEYMPNNYLGTCGLVAISMLLGYYDTYYNDSFIPFMFYDGDYYEWDNNSNAYVFNETIHELLIHRSELEYRNSNTYLSDDWAVVPGTNQSFHDYLFDNYKVTVAGSVGNWVSGGYPMTCSEIRTTINSYIQANCSSLSDYIDTSFGVYSSYTNKINSRQSLANGIPTLLTLTNYSTTPETNNGFHVVLAYGYKDDKFLTNFGWGSEYRQVVLNSSTVHSYYYLEYTGMHTHSQNAYFLNNNETIYVCGCGHVHWPTC